MKRINVSIVCADPGEYPGCTDLLDVYPEIKVIARAESLADDEIRHAMNESNVLVVDDCVLRQDGLETLASIHGGFPWVNILLVHEKYIYNNVIEYLVLGVRGFVARKSIVSHLRRAIPALYSGEVWIPRQMVQSLRKRSTNLPGNSSWELSPSVIPGAEKIN